MSSYTVNDFVHQADAQIGRYGEQAVRFEALAQDSERKRRDIQTRLRAAAAELAASLLPELSESTFQALASRIGAPELVEVLRKGRLRGEQIDARVVAIEQEAAYRERDTLRIKLERQLEEVKPLCDYAVQDYRHLDSLPGLADLVARGYDTPQYKHHGWTRFFHSEYLHDWRRADEICERLKVAAFSEIVVRYSDRKEQAEVLGRSVADLQGQLQRIADLEAERERLLAERAALPDTIRAEAGLRLAALLRNGPGLVDRLDDAETLHARLREMDGLDHQAEYLESLRLRVEEDAGQIRERADKLRAERDRYAANLYRYRNKSFTQEQFAKRFGRDARYDALYDRYQRTGQTIYVFHDYDRAGDLNDFLWWDLMTNGRLDGSYIPEVQSYYDANPGYVFDRSTGVAAGMGAGDFSRDFGGDAS